MIAKPTMERDDPEWKFFDTARVNVSGGDGGKGCVAFRREKGEPMGGPSGGTGGRGGSIYLVCDPSMNTLAPLRKRVHLRAGKGVNGMGKGKGGAAGKDLYIPVPPGTMVRDLTTKKLAGDLTEAGDTLIVAKGGRGGRGNAAFMTPRNTAPRLAEHGEPGAQRWLNVELRLVADVGFLGVPNAGKSTLLAATSAARPKIANYPFTTIIPNLGVCDLEGNGQGLVMCDIPGLIEGAAGGAGLGPAFLRHVQRCKVLLHMVDGSSSDPLGDFRIINKELQEYDRFLSDKPQVVVLNKIDIPEVQEKADDLIRQLKEEAGHSRVLTISAVTMNGIKDLMRRIKKFVDAQPDTELPPPPEIEFSKAGLDFDSDDYEIISDPAYPGQWRLSGSYIEQIAKMTHWEYPEAVERFGRQLQALGIAAELDKLGAEEGDLVMVDKYDFEYSPKSTNPYIPDELLRRDEMAGETAELETAEDQQPWQPYRKGGFLLDDSDEMHGFDSDDWDLLDENFEDPKYNFEVFEGNEQFSTEFPDDEIW
eukprot:CAMPEP_0118675412 /NCGR_PEP_ID=MMETSP0800-20121206/1437_1 /TAXON_ID=210618 ORGANISM="Striatella unipunctata, Strain CCMP2910" /NCGR_SAMPLE_ID=MMETSP0800 /ASSEMBLY_ACC=CAM_ASM_000638 /LENGTH=533 /DNA_ID=CAMNT_0006570731 /DNA_START=276 /DNA_END=1874 /DNA_ORIENTATION=-